MDRSRLSDLGEGSGIDDLGEGSGIGDLGEGSGIGALGEGSRLSDLGEGSWGGGCMDSPTSGCHRDVLGYLEVSIYNEAALLYTHSNACALGNGRNYLLSCTVQTS